ncbi:hypothetical protein LJC07_02985 [Christensenellaceae bacterium OttesenSCG-928-L17]|nr:hypothetical protein [Christensenellaceae bacterium OttesenSCG-928-L17]
MKAETQTYLSASQLVKKTDVRIALRGRLDTLQAEVLLLQAELDGQGTLSEELEDVVSLLHDLILFQCERKVLENTRIFGASLEELRMLSHQCYRNTQFAAPQYKMGIPAARLNLLRAQVREVELLAAEVYAQYPTKEFEAVQYALNRLSSGIYYKFCSLLKSE